MSYLAGGNQDSLKFCLDFTTDQIAEMRSVILNSGRTGSFVACDNNQIITSTSLSGGTHVFDNQTIHFDETLFINDANVFFNDCIIYFPKDVLMVNARNAYIQLDNSKMIRSNNIAGCPTGENDGIKFTE